MPSVQLLLVLPLGLAVTVAWFGGAEPERRATAAVLVTWALGLAGSDWHLGRVVIGLVVSDLALLIVLGGMALRQDRWWLLLATAAQLLVVAAHAAFILRPELTPASNLAALAVFETLGLFALILGVAERWLAGEPRTRSRQDFSPARA